MPRPSTFTQTTADIICERIASGRSLLSITHDENMPSLPTVLRWARNFPDFLRQYAFARELQADAIFDECLDIADDVTLGTHEDIQRARLRIATRQWMAGKLRPRKYGAQIDVTQSDLDGRAIDEIQDIPQVARKIAFILAQAVEPARISGNGAIAEVKPDGNGAAH